MTGLFVTYDPDADALYVRLRHVGPGGIRGARELDESRHVDYDYEDAPVGVEFLNASDGVDLEDVPMAAEIRVILEQLFATRFTSKSAA